MNRAKLQQQREWIQQRVNTGSTARGFSGFSAWDALELLDALLGEGPRPHGTLWWTRLEALEAQMRERGRDGLYEFDELLAMETRIVGNTIRDRIDPLANWSA